MTQVSERINAVNGEVRQVQAGLAVAVQAYIATSAAGRVKGWDAVAERIFGYDAAQVSEGDIIDLIIPARFRDVYRADLARLSRIAAGDPSRVLGQQLQLTALHRDGYEFPIEMTVTVTEEPDGRMFHTFRPRHHRRPPGRPVRRRPSRHRSGAERGGLQRHCRAPGGRGPRREDGLVGR